jgi:hypothetical protein
MKKKNPMNAMKANKRIPFPLNVAPLLWGILAFSLPPSALLAQVG